MKECCDNCKHLDECSAFIRRCFPNGELTEQCETCKPCPNFVERPESPFVTAHELLRTGGFAD